MDIKTAIVLPDLQLPYVDSIALNAVEKLIADYKWDYWIQLGDFMDFDYISKWTEKNLKVITGTTFTDDYEMANEFLDRHQKLVRSKNPKAEMVIIQGNHDYRPVKVIEKDPRYEGLIDFHLNLKLKARKIKFIRFWEKGEVYEIGHASFIHGIHTNDHHAKKTVTTYGTNIFYGHTHDIQCYSLTYKGAHKTIVGQSLGTLSKYNLAYIQGKPTRWQQAVTVFYFFPNGDFTYSVIRIINGRFIFNGKIYDGYDKGTRGSLRANN